MNFPSRWHFSLTSSPNNNDGYITGVSKSLPVENAEAIVLNSKVIYVNRKLVEGSDYEIICDIIRKEPAPPKLMLCMPDGLDADEKPWM